MRITSIFCADKFLHVFSAKLSLRNCLVSKNVKRLIVLLCNFYA